MGKKKKKKKHPIDQYAYGYWVIHDGTIWKWPMKTPMEKLTADEKIDIATKLGKEWV